MKNSKTILRGGERMNKKRIIIIIAIVVLIVAGLFWLFLGNKNDNSTKSDTQSNNKNEQLKSNDEIEKIYIGTSSSAALTKSGDLYVVGKSDYGWAGLKETKDATLVASNVKDFKSDGDTYIDNNGDLYVTGLNPIKGGVFKEYEKIGSNIKYTTSGGLGLMAISNEGDLYAWGKEQYNGIEKKCDTLTKVEGASNVKYVVNGLSMTYYLTESGEFFCKNSMTKDKFEKVFDNVDEIIGSCLKTKDNKIYKFSWNDKTKKVDIELMENIDGIVKLADGSAYATLNGKRVNDAYSWDQFNDEYPEDVKELMYYRGGTYTGKADRIYIYKNDNNKFAFSIINNETKERTTKEFDNNVNVLNEIYNLMYAK